MVSRETDFLNALRVLKAVVMQREVAMGD